MGATIYWKPANEHGTPIHIGWPSKFQEVLQSAVGDRFCAGRIILCLDDIPALQGIMSMCDESDKAEINNLITALEEHEKISLEWVY